MKTVNKFSVLLLLTTAALHCSNALAQKTNKDSIKTWTASCACGQLTATIVGPDPERRSICYCHLCQKQSGSAFSVQARFPKEQVTIKGKSTAWRFPPTDGVTPVTGRTCADGGGTFHFCPVCGSTVWYTADADTARIGIKMGTIADPTFPPPLISGFEEYKFPWAMNVSALPMPGGITTSGGLIPCPAKDGVHY
jgi:hypothetical protein